MSEYIADGAALTHTADRIRAKTGGTDPITWDAAKGFGDAVDAIQAGGSALIESGTIDMHTGTSTTAISVPVSDDSLQYYLVILNATASWLKVDGAWTKQDGITFDGVSDSQFPCQYLMGIYPTPEPLGWINSSGAVCTPTAAKASMVLRTATARTDSAYEIGPNVSKTENALKITGSSRPFCAANWGLTFEYTIVGWNDAQ